MLYLMMDKTDKEYLVKVGYSKGGTTQRRSQYRGYNPRAIVRSSCAGSKEMEKACRKVLTECGGERVKGTEWFIVSYELFNLLYAKGMSIFYPKHEPIHFLENY